MKIGDRVALAHPKAMGKVGLIVGQEIYELRDGDGDVVAQSCPEFIVQMEGKEWCWRHWRMHTPVYSGLSADQLVPVVKP